MTERYDPFRDWVLDTWRPGTGSGVERLDVVLQRLFSGMVRPGGSSAKTSHRAGSPNHQSDSKEALIVGPRPADGGPVVGVNAAAVGGAR